MKKEFIGTIVIGGLLFIAGCVLQGYYPEKEISLGSVFLMSSFIFILYDLLKG